MDSLIDELITLAKGFASVSSIHVGALPVAESISIYNAPSSDDDTFLDKSSTYTASFTFLSKYANQKDAINKLDAIGKGMARLTTFPTVTGMQIYNIDYVGRVNYVDKDTDNKYIYSIVIDVKISD